MRYVWEAVDIVPGRKVQAHNRTETWMIGYDPRANGPRLALISLADGMINEQGKTVQEFTHILNNQGMRPVDIVMKDIQSEKER